MRFLESTHNHNRTKKNRKGVFPIIRFRDKGQAVLALLVLLTIGIYAVRNGFLGANADWMSQHTVFPDYFRNLFYETGDLFPNYAANIGAGQNLYNFSYYGFLNPLILVSYLFPFVPMPVYIMAVSLICLAAACLLFYNWLKGKGFTEFINVSASMIFLLASPMFYHTYKQIMFINYMPFLCLSLIGVDRYFRAGKKGLLTAGVFLMIMSSFYFSVGGLLAVCLYWLSVYLSKTPELRAGDLIRSGVLFMIPILTAVLMAGILLVPTAFTLLESHRTVKAAADFSVLLTPQFKLLRYAYSPYGIGLPSIAITILLAGLFYRKLSERVLALGMITVSLFPIFLFLLNGGLYVRDKALIPFLPLVCYMVALFFQKLEFGGRGPYEGISDAKLLTFFLTTAALTLLGAEQTVYWIAVFADALLMLLLYFIYRKRRDLKIFLVPVILIMLFTGLVIQNPEKLVSVDVYRELYDPDIHTAMQEVNSADPSFYRMDSFLNKDTSMNQIDAGGQYLTSFYSSAFQKDYLDFRCNVFQLERPYRNYMMQPASQNPLFLTFMGVKYVRSDYAPAGYDLFVKKDEVKIYRNNNVFPLGYVTNDLTSEKALKEYGFPYRQELLLHRAVVGEITDSSGLPDFRTKIKPAVLAFPEYRIKSSAETTRTIRLERPAPEDEVLFLEMKVKNLKPLQDMSIKIQNEQNRLSAKNHVYYNRNTVFHYAVSVKKGAVELPVVFSPGEYELSSVRCYTLSESDMTAAGRKSGSFQVSAINARGKVISGSVDAPKNGWFVTTVPYDPNFQITVDGNEISFEKVNTAFIGFPITQGFHSIVFRYVSPGFIAGAIVSLSGILMFVLSLCAAARRAVSR